MPYYTAVLHAMDWVNTTAWIPIPETINKVAVGGGQLASAMTTLTGAGQPGIYGTAVSDCFFEAVASVLPATGDPPFPAVWPYLFASGDIYGRNNLNQNLKFVRNDDYTFNIGVTLNGAPVDLTNCTLRLTAKWNTYDSDANAVFSVHSPAGILITSPSTGIAQVTIAAALTAALPAHVVLLPFDIQMYTAAGLTKTLLLGTLTIVPDISTVVP